MPPILNLIYFLKKRKKEVFEVKNVIFDKLKYRVTKKINSNKKR